MACRRFVDRLRAHAIGAPLDADAAAHLAVCSACLARLEGETRVQRAIDDAIDGVKAVGPSPDLLPRVRVEIEHRARTRRADGWALAPLVAVALVVLIVVVLKTTASRQPAASVTTTASDVNQPPAVRPTLEAAPAVMRAPAARAPRAAETGTPRAAATRAPRSPADPEVLVPAGERQAMDRLFQALRAGRPEVVSMLMRIGPVSSAPDAAPLTVPPLRVESVPIPALPGGSPDQP
jgi:hypothetical protein